MRLKLRNDANGLLPIRNCQSFKTVVLQKEGEHLLNRNFIFNNQNAFLIGELTHKSPLLIHQIVWRYELFIMKKPFSRTATPHKWETNFSNSIFCRSISIFAATCN